MTLKPCPCGKTPTELSTDAPPQAKHGYVYGDCCMDWSVEVRLAYKEGDELYALMVDGWNEAPRGGLNNA